MAISTTQVSSRHDTAVTAACLAIVAWACGPLLVRGFSVSTPTILFFRMLVATPVMVLASYVVGGGLSKAAVKAALLPGVLFSLNVISSFESYRTTAILHTTIIQSLSPALVLLVAGWLFGEHSTRRQLALAGVAFVGVMIVIATGSSTKGASLHGDLYAVVNLLIWTMYFLRMKHVRSTVNVDSWSLIASIFIVGSVILMPWAAITSGDLGAMRANDWWLSVALVAGPGLVGHGLMTWAQRDLDVTLASLLSLGSAPISTVGAWLIFDQELHAAQVFGSAVVIVALALIVLDRPGTPTPPPAVGEPEPA